MSEKLPSLVKDVKDTDLTASEVNKVQIYKQNGLPGISEVTDAMMHRMLDLYLTGSTYSQISQMLNIKKTTILYLAHVGQWYLTKQEYINEAQEKIKSRVIDAKVRNQEFMLLLVQAWQKKIGGQLVKYLATNDSEHMDDIDLKEVAQLMKAIDMVNELDNTGKDSKGKTPAVGLNVGNGVVVEKTGENTISITPKETSIGDMLEQYANDRREKEKVVVVSKSDITSNQKE